MCGAANCQIIVVQVIGMCCFDEYTGWKISWIKNYFSHFVIFFHTRIFYNFNEFRVYIGQDKLGYAVGTMNPVISMIYDKLN